VPVLERLDALQPGDPSTLYLLGAALANSGRLDEAVAPLERARALAPDDAEVLRALEDLSAHRNAAPDGSTRRTAGSDG
jgi:Flp pilus assembly protein TadD